MSLCLRSTYRTALPHWPHVSARAFSTAATAPRSVAPGVSVSTQCTFRLCSMYTLGKGDRTIPQSERCDHIVLKVPGALHMSSSIFFILELPIFFFFLKTEEPYFKRNVQGTTWPINTLERFPVFLLESIFPLNMTFSASWPWIMP